MSDLYGLGVFKGSLEPDEHHGAAEVDKELFREFFFRDDQGIIVRASRRPEEPFVFVPMVAELEKEREVAEGSQVSVINSLILIFSIFFVV